LAQSPIAGQFVQLRATSLYFLYFLFACRLGSCAAKRRAVLDGRAVLSFVAVKEAGLRTAAVATALNVTARAVARVLPLGARLARERDIGLARLQIDTGKTPASRCAARLPRLPSA
jgi:hypothetical protein